MLTLAAFDRIAVTGRSRRLVESRLDPRVIFVPVAEPESSARAANRGDDCGARCRTRAGGLVDRVVVPASSARRSRPYHHARGRARSSPHVHERRIAHARRARLLHGARRGKHRATASDGADRQGDFLSIGFVLWLIAGPSRESRASVALVSRRLLPYASSHHHRPARRPAA